MKERAAKGDFTQGDVRKTILFQSVPMILAQLVQLLYNIVDRIYIGHLPGAENGMALTGIGLTFPLTALTAAFTNLFGTGGAPLFAIERGKGNDKTAEKILGNTSTLLLGCSIIIFTVCYIFQRPVLYLFGAGDQSCVYAEEYLSIYLFGTPFLMLSTGLNGFINAQGFPRIGMLTIALGAVLNLALDPLFIFVLDMGVGGAALATVISQLVSFIWVIKFLTGKKAGLHIRKSCMKPDFSLVKRIVSLGFAGFIMQGTNFLVQIACNTTLKQFGGELYVGVMTVVNSVREVLSLPVHGLTSGSQPVLGYNYGAREFDRVKKGIRFVALMGVAYTAAAWLFVVLAPEFLMSIFTDDNEMISTGISALHIYFFGFIFMSFQFIGQSSFTALGYSKKAIFFSLLRKAIIVVPLTLLLPRLGMGVNGVFAAEPISNLTGGLACFLTMYFTVYKKLGKNNDKAPE